MIVGIYAPQPQSGKTAVSRAFVEAGFKRLSFGMTVKLCMIPILVGLGVPEPHEYLFGDKKDQSIPNLGDDTMTGGMLLSTFATKYVRGTVDENVWLNIVQRVYEADPTKHYVIDDIRFHNEYSWVFDCPARMLIDVRRPALPNEKGAHGRCVESEGLLNKHYFQETIWNIGTLAELEAKSLTLAKKVCLEHGIIAHNSIQ